MTVSGLAGRIGRGTFVAGLAAWLAVAGCSSDEPPNPGPSMTGQVSGQVTRDGAPYTGMTVRLVDVQGNSRTTTSSATGYRFVNVPAGPARVRLTVPVGLVLVSPDSAEKSVVVSAGAETIGPSFVLDDPPLSLATLRAHVRQNGTGVPGVEVRVNAPPIPAFSGTTDLNGDAQFELNADLATQATVGITAPPGLRILDPPGSPQVVALAAATVSDVNFELAAISGGLPDGTPLNDTPQNTMIRFERAYEYQVHEEYDRLFAGNFVFHFSTQSDPDLVTQFGNNWGAKFESDAALHLFDGFQNEDGETVPGATRIDLIQNSPSFGNHPDFPADSLAHYEWVAVPRLVLEIEVPGTPEPIVYDVDARQEFYLVRGDAAALRPGQEARADRWYIYRWDDMSQPLAAPNTAPARWMPTTSKTWGQIKAQYLR